MNSKASMKHNGLIYALMDVTATGHERQKEDRPETLMLAEGRKIAATVEGVAGVMLVELFDRLIEHDERENADHDFTVRRSKDACRLIEFPQNETAVNVISINSGRNGAA